MSTSGELIAEVRAMTVDDIPAVMVVELAAYPFPWTAAIFRDCLKSAYHGYVWEIDGVLAAYAMTSVAVGEMHLLNLAVAPHRQSRGVGRRLLRHVMASSRELGADMMFLEVRPSNIHAIALYLSEGLGEIGQRRGYYPAAGGREDALVMARSL